MRSMNLEFHIIFLIEDDGDVSVRICSKVNAKRERAQERRQRLSSFSCSLQDINFFLINNKDIHFDG